jgi:hypothetical protein
MKKLRTGKKRNFAQMISTSTSIVNQEVIKKSIKKKSIDSPWLMKYISEVNEIKDVVKLENAKSVCKWSSMRTTQLLNEKAHYYECAINDCMAQLKLTKENEGSDISVFRRINHNHDYLNFQDIVFHDKIKYSREVKQLIADLSDNFVPPRKILSTLIKKQANKEVGYDIIPEYNTIKTILQLHRRDKVKDLMSNTISSYSSWCEEKSKVTDENELFVLNSSFENDRFLICFSSPQLLKNAKNQEEASGYGFICTDGTYKTNNMNFPLLVLGTTDIEHKFRAIAFCLSSNEDGFSYEFMFSTVKKHLKEFYKFDFQPEFIMADGAQSITNAVSEVFGDNITRLMCYWHLKKNVKLNCNLSKEDREEFLKDIDILNLCQNEGDFNHGCKLLLKKWEPIDIELTNYFQKTYVDNYSNWFVASSPIGMGVTNNNCEGFNNLIKRQYTCRKRLPIADLLKVFETMIKDLSSSNEKLGHCYYFPKELDYRKALYKKMWMKVQTIKHEEVLNNEELYVFKRKSSNFDMTTSSLSRIFTHNKNIKQFKDFKLKFDVWVVDSQEKTCSCPCYYKTSVCKHILFVFNSLKHMIVPSKFNMEFIEALKKKNNKRKVKSHALVKD